jgi:hypothetical protein
VVEGIAMLDLQNVGVDGSFPQIADVSHEQRAHVCTATDTGAEPSTSHPSVPGPAEPRRRGARQRR